MYSVSPGSKQSISDFCKTFNGYSNRRTQPARQLHFPDDGAIQCPFSTGQIEAPPPGSAEERKAKKAGE
jgi:hypothetical protein